MTWQCLECGAANPPANLICGSAICQERRAGSGNAIPANGGEGSGSKTTPSTANGKRKKHFYPPEFEEFWSAYPRKDDKVAALRAWKRAIAGGVSADVLREGASRYSRDPKRDPNFTKYAERWINAGSYLNSGEVERPPSHEVGYDVTDHEAYLRSLEDVS